MTTQTTEGTQARDAGVQSQFVAFQIDEREFAVDIMAVRELRGWVPPTKIPNVAPSIMGVVNLRGAIVPILDMRICFGQPVTDLSRNNVVIIVVIDTRMTGLLVDAVTEILTVQASQMQALPGMEGLVGNRVVAELIALDQRLVGVISLEKLIDGAQLTAATGAES